MRKGLGVVLVGVLGVACGDGGGSPGDGDASADGGDDAATTVAGTVTLPADGTDRCAMIAIDTDTTGANGTAQREDSSYLASNYLVAGSSVEFSIDRVPAGTYYLWGYVDADSSASDPLGDCEILSGPNTGDHLGYFDTGLGPPGAPNVLVPHAGETFDFSLGVFP